MAAAISVAPAADNARGALYQAFAPASSPAIPWPRPAHDEPGDQERRAAELFRAVMRSDLAVIEECLVAGAEINRTNAAGVTALELAYERGRKESASYLVQRGIRYLIADLAPAHRGHRRNKDWIGWENQSPQSLMLLELSLRFPEIELRTLGRLLSFHNGRLPLARDSARMHFCDLEARQEGHMTTGSAAPRRPHYALASKVAGLYPCMRDDTDAIAEHDLAVGELCHRIGCSLDRDYAVRPEISTETTGKRYPRAVTSDRPPSAGRLNDSGLTDGHFSDGMSPSLRAESSEWFPERVADGSGLCASIDTALEVAFSVANRAV